MEKKIIIDRNISIYLNHQFGCVDSPADALKKHCSTNGKREVPLLIPYESASFG